MADVEHHRFCREVAILDGVVEGAPGHELGEAGLGHAGRREGSDEGTVAQHRHPGTDVENFGQAVADEDDRDALRREPAHDHQQGIGLGLAQRRRGFVHEHEACLGHEGAGDGHDLPLGDRQGPHRPVKVEVDAEPPEDPACIRPHRTMVDKLRTDAEIALERDVLGNRQFWEQREVLPDDLQAERPRLRRVEAGDGRSVEHHDRATLGLVNPADDLDQRALAAAVLACEAEHLAR